MYLAQPSSVSSSSSQEWTSRSGNAAVSEAALRALVAGEAGGAAVDTSAQRVVLRIGGRLTRELLSFGCSLDLHPRSFPAGRSAQTLLGGAGVILLARDSAADADGGAVLDVHVRSSFAGHLADWLLDAAQEFRETPRFPGSIAERPGGTAHLRRESPR